MENVLKGGDYEFRLGYKNVDWFPNEVIKLENEMAFYVKNTKKDIIMTEENEKDFKTTKICRSCEKQIKSDEVRDHCHLTGKYRGPACSICNIIVTQNRSFYTIFIS